MLYCSGEPVVAPFLVTMICLLLSLNDTVWGKLTANKLSSKSTDAIKPPFKPASTVGFTTVVRLRACDFAYVLQGLRLCGYW
jgi:hypothetical protein